MSNILMIIGIVLLICSVFALVLNLLFPLKYKPTEYIDNRIEPSKENLNSDLTVPAVQLNTTSENDYDGSTLLINDSEDQTTELLSDKYS